MGAIIYILVFAPFAIALGIIISLLFFTPLYLGARFLFLRKSDPCGKYPLIALSCIALSALFVACCITINFLTFEAPFGSANQFARAFFAALIYNLPGVLFWSWLEIKTRGNHVLFRPRWNETPRADVFE